MAYIGREPQIGNFQVCDAISVVNGQAAYTMQVSSVNVSPETANHMIVSLNGIIQAPGSSYTVSGSTITFASNLVTGDVIDFIHILGSVLDLGVPSDSTVSLAKLTATGTKDATTFLRGDNTFAEAGGGSLVKLHSVTTTDANTTNIDFTSTYITTTYDNYLVLGKVKVATDDAECRVRFSESGTFQDGASYYGIGILNEGAGSTNDNDISYMTLDTGGAGNASGEGVSFNATFFNLRDSSIFSCMNFIRTNINADNFHSMQVGSGGTDAAADHDGIRFYLSSGNFASGTTITLYGYEK